MRLGRPSQSIFTSGLTAAAAPRPPGAAGGLAIASSSLSMPRSSGLRSCLVKATVCNCIEVCRPWLAMPICITPAVRMSFLPSGVQRTWLAENSSSSPICFSGMLPSSGITNTCGRESRSIFEYASHLPSGETSTLLMDEISLAATALAAPDSTSTCHSLLSDADTKRLLESGENVMLRFSVSESVSLRRPLPNSSASQTSSRPPSSER